MKLLSYTFIYATRFSVLLKIDVKAYLEEV